MALRNNTNGFTSLQIRHGISHEQEEIKVETMYNRFRESLSKSTNKYGN
jgi:hypothetical protein